MSRLEKHAEKKEDNYSIGSRQKIKAAFRHKLKCTFVGALAAVEQEIGSTDKEMFKRIRSKILSIGNDQIRNMEIELERYNIEFIPYQITILSPEKLLHKPKDTGE
jgi:hypothetical protein